MAGSEFREFVAARSPVLLRAAFLLTGDWQHAEDLLQAALLRCYGRWDRIDRHEAYVRTTMVRLAVGWRRRRWVGEIPTTPPDHAVPGAALDDRVAVRADLLRSLLELGPRQRAVLVLRFYEDLSEAEVADVLGVSIGTVKSQAARGLAHLRASAHAAATIEEEAR